MPEISRFLGIVVRMYYQDHAPPHFHAEYGDYEIKVFIDSGATEGTFPTRARALVLEWLGVHRAELLADWTRATERRPLLPIDPLE